MLFNVWRYRNCKAAGLLQIVSDACFNASDDFISPSAAITFALASRDASASAAIALCNAVGSETSFLHRTITVLLGEWAKKGILFQNLVYISTRSTLTPHGSVASSKDDCIVCEIASRSVNNSERFRVPKTLRKVVAANSLVEWL